MPSAAILAGGHARRFGGRDKSALAVDGRTILERQIEMLSQITDDIMIVAGDGQWAVGGGIHGDGRWAMGDGGPAIRVIVDRVADMGPLGGLDAALAEARDRELVLLACDMPFASARFLAHLVSRASGVDAVVPRTERGYHPLCAVYARECRPVVAEHLAEGRLRMTDLLGRIRVREIPREEIEGFGPSDRLLANINTPGEFENLETLAGHKL
jgi:molybdopterin-guanine dinucleotide biosynthesis protein A